MQAQRTPNHTSVEGGQDSTPESYLLQSPAELQPLMSLANQTGSVVASDEVNAEVDAVVPADGDLFHSCCSNVQRRGGGRFLLLLKSMIISLVFFTSLFSSLLVMHPTTAVSSANFTV